MKINIVPTIFLALCQEYQAGTDTLVRRLVNKMSLALRAANEPFAKMLWKTNEERLL